MNRDIETVECIIQGIGGNHEPGHKATVEFFISNPGNEEAMNHTLELRLSF